MNERYLTIEEVAGLFGVTRQTVYNWLAEGRIQAVKLGGVRRIIGSSVDLFVARGRTEASKEDWKKEADNDPGSDPGAGAFFENLIQRTQKQDDKKSE